MIQSLHQYFVQRILAVGDHCAAGLTRLYLTNKECMSYNLREQTSHGQVDDSNFETIVEKKHSLSNVKVVDKKGLGSLAVWMTEAKFSREAKELFENSC